MATYAEEQAARFAAEKKAREEEGLFSRIARKFSTDKTSGAAPARAAPASAPASSTRSLMEGRGKAIDTAVDKATLRRGGSVKAPAKKVVARKPAKRC